MSDVTPLTRVHHLTRRSQVPSHRRMSRIGVVASTIPQEKVALVDRHALALGVLLALSSAHVITGSVQAGAQLLCFAADDEGFVEMSATEIACRLSCSISTARRILHDLKAAGVLHIARTGKGHKAALYEVYALPLVRGSEADPCR